MYVVPSCVLVNNLILNIFFSFQLSEEPVKEKEKQVEKKEEIVGVGTLTWACVIFYGHGRGAKWGP